jgi:Flp pilus assembly protein TadG
VKFRRLREAVGGQRGSAIMEFAFVLPLLLLLTFGIVEFGRAWLIVNTLNHAAREAVRLAATTTALKGNDPAVVNKAQAILTAAGVRGASVTNTSPSGAPPAVTVTTAVNLAFLTGIGPLLNFSFAGTIPLTSSATMRYER